MKENKHDLTEGAFLSTHGAPSSSGALLDARWFQAYTAPVRYILCVSEM